MSTTVCQMSIIFFVLDEYRQFISIDFPHWPIPTTGRVKAVFPPLCGVRGAEPSVVGQQYRITTSRVGLALAWSRELVFCAWILSLLKTQTEINENPQ